MEEAVNNSLEAVRSALRRHAWQDAFNALKEVDPTSLTPQDLEGLAEGAWWLGRLSECIGLRERAYTAHLQAGSEARAGLVAVALAKDHFGKGESAIGSAWLKRAERLLDHHRDSVEYGYFERMHAVMAFEGARDFERALEHSRRVEEIGTRFKDRDLIALGVHDQGRVLVAMGRVAEGMNLLDEATVAAVSGELSPLATGFIYCNVIVACEEIADYQRAAEWTGAAKRWCERMAVAGFPGMCRVHRAGIMFLRGVWNEAEQEARLACDELRDFNHAYAAAALYELGEIRLRMGDLVSAEDAFRQAHALGRDPQPGMALFQLADGKVSAAAGAIRHALEDEAMDRLNRARLLPAQVEIALAAGDLETARRAADELQKIAEAYGTPALQAASLSALGALRVAEGDSAGAAKTLRRASALWHEVDVPYEVARNRLLLAAAYLGEGDAESAALEAEAAQAAFERLGARTDAQRARDLARETGGTAKSTGERTAATFMFTDVVGSTSLVEAIGDSAWDDLRRWHNRTLRWLFGKHAGKEIDQTGDGFFVAFADTTAAVDCAVSIQRALAEHRRTHGFAPQVRIGIHGAQAIWRDGTYAGKGVHEAARIAALAEGGEIVASRSSLDGVTIGHAVVNQRSARLKGLAEPIEVVTVSWR